MYRPGGVKYPTPPKPPQTQTQTQTHTHTHTFMFPVFSRHLVSSLFASQFEGVELQMGGIVDMLLEQTDHFVEGEVKVKPSLSLSSDTEAFCPCCGPAIVTSNLHSSLG